jgi:hypothetical protein
MKKATPGMALLALFACGSIQADPVSDTGAPGLLGLTTKRVVVFKDGHGLFVKEARGKAAGDGTVFTDQVPEAASLGSFWVSDRKDKIAHTVASRATRVKREKIMSDCTNVFEILRANQGKQATIVTHNGDVHRGVLRHVLESTAGQPAKTFSPVSYLHHTRALKPSPAPPPQAATGTHFILSSEEGDTLLAISQVRSVKIKGMSHQHQREEKTNREVKLLTVHYKKPRPGRSHVLDLLYFRPGIRWIPTYRIELGEDGQATIVMQAEVINEAEDFARTPVDFVVGVPNFRFADVVSPLSLERVMINALTQASPQLKGQLASQSFDNALFRARAGERHSAQPAGGDGGISDAAMAMQGAEAQDLFYYSTRNLSLRKGQRAVVEVFRAVVPYRHVYTWNPGPSGSTARQHGSSPLKYERNQVWHQVILQNRTSLPWTTGPAMLLQNGRPLGQDLLTFTPAGREVMVPVTEAVSLRGTISEKEISRKERATKFNGYYYAMIEAERSFKVVSSLKREAPLVITAELNGECLRADSQGRVEYSGQHPHRRSPVPVLNLYSKVVWTATIPAGKSRTVSVRFRYFVRE